MNITALIAYKNEYELFNVNSISSNGFPIGAGKILRRYWINLSDVMSICDGKSLERLSYDEIESTYENKDPIKKRKNLTFEELCDLSKKFDYTYFFDLIRWYLLEDQKIIDLYELF